MGTDSPLNGRGNPDWKSIAAVRRTLRQAVLQKQPAGSFTSRQYAERYKISQPHAISSLNTMLAKGLITRARAYIPDWTGRKRQIWVYIPVSAGKKKKR